MVITARMLGVAMALALVCALGATFVAHSNVGAAFSAIRAERLAAQ